MRIRITRKNKKRRDPRYFLQESVEEETAEKTVEESYRIPGSEGDMSSPGAHNITPESDFRFDMGEGEASTKRMLQGLDATNPGDFEGVVNFLVGRALEYNEKVKASEGEFGRRIELDKLFARGLEHHKGEDGEL